MSQEALAASRRPRERGVLASVFVVTSPDHLYRDLRGPAPYLETLVGADEEGVPVVSVLDGHSHALAFIGAALGDRKSTRLNSSHGYISYAVFCLKKKKQKRQSLCQHKSADRKPTTASV